MVDQLKTRRMRRRLFGLFCCLTIFGGLGGVAAAEPRLIITGGKDNELKGYLVKCGAVSAVEIRAPEGAYFETDRGEFGKMARNVRFIVANDCRGLRKITFTGTVNGVLWYAGAVSADRGRWRLYGIYAPPK